MSIFQVIQKPNKFPNAAGKSHTALKYINSSNKQVPKHLTVQQTIPDQEESRPIHSDFRFSFDLIQTKPTVGHVDDAYEKEADRVAEEIMRMSEPVTAVTAADKKANRKCKKCEEKIGRKASSMNYVEVSDNIAQGIDSLRGRGSPLDPLPRAFMESHLGYDFSKVRIHTDSQAAEAARVINARAFTVGRDIVFEEGEYAPNTFEGKRLLAHELTHVMQQNKLNRSESSRIWRQEAKNGGTCTPASGIPNTNCTAYISNSWWLPLAYVNNATCACLQTPNSPTANCVRKFLQDRLASTPTWLKIMAASMKPLEISDPLAYQSFVQAILTPRIYKDHVDAYANCCCPCGPAPYPAWIGVTTVPLPCSFVGWSIRQFGSCHCTPGTW